MTQEKETQTKLPPTAQVWKGAEVLRAYLVPIDSLEDHQRNPNKGDVAAISASLEKFGQVRAILHQNGTIIAGHHVRQAAQLLEWTHIAALEHSFVDDHEALQYLLVDNQLTKLSKIDAEETYGILMDLESAGYAETPGFGIDEMEILRDKAGATPTAEARDWEGEAGESPEAAAARAAAIAQYEQHREVVLLLSFPEQYEAFAKDVRLLMAEYGTTGTVATIVRAVANAAQAAAAGDEAEERASELDVPAAEAGWTGAPEPEEAEDEPGFVS